MNLAEVIELGELFRRLAASDSAAFDETDAICRVDQLPGLSEDDLNKIGQLAFELSRSGKGKLEVFGEISGQVDLGKQNASDLADEAVSVRLTKSAEPGSAYFLTPSGFEAALGNGRFMLDTIQIWIADEFEPFTTQRCVYSPWGTAYAPAAAGEPFDSPTRLVRDQSHQLTPEDIAPWYLTSGGKDDSLVFAAWKAHAAKNLAFTLPTEVRPQGASFQVVLKGARSAFAEVDRDESPSALFGLLSDAVRWVYDQRRDTETKFHLLNNHLALYWADGSKWPQGLADALDNALASAREAFAFHLQEDSKEAIKSLGDLRKALQDEVTRSQLATRDLLSALWRDAAIAGAVFALRIATVNAASLNLIATSAAFLLCVSLVTTILSNWRFDVLAQRVREQWRKRLYAFMSEEQWEDLVRRPISRARLVYRLSIVPVFLIYAVLIAALLWVPYPSLVEPLGEFLLRLPQGIGQIIGDLQRVSTNAAPPL